MSNQSKSWTDRTGIALSVLCVMHCLAAPTLLVLMPALLPEALFHWAMLVLVLPISGFSFYQGYQQHQSKVLLILSGLGLSLLILAVLIAEPWFGHQAETWFTVCGALLLLLGHRANLKLCHSDSNLSVCSQRKVVPSAFKFAKLK
jgi:hypothetical protein